MELVSFNAFRSLDIPAARYIKPELFFSHLVCCSGEFNVFFGNRGLAEQGVRLGERILDHLRAQDDKPTGPEVMPPVAA